MTIKNIKKKVMELMMILTSYPISIVMIKQISILLLLNIKIFIYKQDNKIFNYS